MEVESAFEALELAGPVPRAALKRAYLKAVRKHPPERDPEGFRRVRDAFEWLEARPWLCAGPEPEDPRAEPLPSPSPPPPPPRVVEQVAEREPDLERPLPGPPPETEALPKTEAEPQSPAEPAPLELDFHALIEPIDPKALLELGNGVLRALAPARSLTAHPPPASLVVHLVLRLIEQREPDLASDLIEAFQQALDEQRYPLRALPSETIGVWQLVREVEDLRGEVPDKLRRRLARGIREGDFEPAVAAFERASAEQGAGLHVTVQREAPTLYAALWPRLERETAGSNSKPGRVGWILGWRFLWAILILARCAFSSSDPPSRSTSVAPPPVVVAPGPPTLAVPAAAASELRAGEPGVAKGELTDLQRDLVERSIDQAIERHDCATLFEQWPLYEGSFESREEKRRAAHAACPELVPTLR